MCWCRVIETRGSTPQKAGAVMVVGGTGQQAGTLGGGCVEAEVKRAALAGLGTASAQIREAQIREAQIREAQISEFVLDHDYGWDDGLICGGRMKVLLVPVTPADDPTYFRQLHQFVREGRGYTEVVRNASLSDGGSSATMILFDERRRPVGVIGAGETAAVAAESLTEHVRDLDTAKRHYTVGEHTFLPVAPRGRLVIVGGGHVGKAVAELAVDLDFDVWVVDDREEYVSESRFPGVQQRIGGEIDTVLPRSRD